jgi:hypothetical protein
VAIVSTAQDAKGRSFVRYYESAYNELIMVLPAPIYDDPAQLAEAQTFFGPSVRIIREEKPDVETKA